MLEEEIKEILKHKKEEILYKVYDIYRNEFFQYINRYGLPKEDVLDIYQDAFIALLENARKGKLDGLTSSVKTYFFAIGKYMVFNKLKKEQKSVHMESMDLHNFEENVFEFEQENQDNPSIIKIQNALREMGGKCKELLTLFYYQEKKLDEIVFLMNYENKDVAKSQKSRCLKNLKNLLK